MQIEKLRAQISLFSYTYVMVNMNLLAVVTPPSIYHGCFTWKTLWEEKFTLDEFTALNMKNYGRRNVSKHRQNKGSDK